MFFKEPVALGSRGVFNRRRYPLALGPAGQVKFAAQGAAVGAQDNIRPLDHRPSLFLAAIAHLLEANAELCAHGFFRANCGYSSMHI